MGQDGAVGRRRGRAWARTDCEQVCMLAGELGSTAQETTHMFTLRPPTTPPCSLTRKQLQEEAPAVTAAIILHFDTGRITGAPAPLPSRLTAQHEGRFAREELGLYRENQCVLSENSLNKTEQRIAKAATLDRRAAEQRAEGGTKRGRKRCDQMGVGGRGGRKRPQSEFRGREGYDACPLQPACVL